MVQLFCVILGVMLLPGFSNGQSSELWPTGIAIYRDRVGQSDEFAKAFIFQRIARYTAVTNFFISSPSPLIIENSRVVTVLMFEEFQQKDFVDDTDLAMLSHQLSFVRDTMKKFPAANEQLRKVSETLQLYVSKMGAGQVKFRGSWTTAMAYQLVVNKEIQAVEEERRQQKQIADDKDKRKKAEEIEKLRRESNLKIHPSTLAGEWLIKEFGAFVIAVEKTQSDAVKPLKLPEKIITGALELPLQKDYETGLREGSGTYSPAILFLYKGNECRAFCLGVPFKLDGDEIVNKQELQGALFTISSFLPEVSGWLPLAIVSAKTKLDFQNKKGAKKEYAVVERNFSGHVCEVKLSETQVNDDGVLYSKLIIIIN